MTPPRWPFLVEIDALSQLNLFFATNKQTTVPMGMRIVGRNLDRDTYFIAPLGLHLLYRRLMRRYDRAQLVLQRLREADTVKQQPLQVGQYYPAPQTSSVAGLTNGITTYQMQWQQNLPSATATATNFSCSPCTCASCSTQQTP